MNIICTTLLNLEIEKKLKYAVIFFQRLTYMHNYTTEKTYYAFLDIRIPYHACIDIKICSYFLDLNLGTRKMFTYWKF